jgi:hypothetical protein
VDLRREQIERADLVTRSQKFIGQMRADEPRSAGY